jgi:hypothetical protein
MRCNNTQPKPHTVDSQLARGLHISWVREAKFSHFNAHRRAKMSTFYVIARNGLRMTQYLTESRSAGVGFEAPGNSVTGVGVSNLKSWRTAKGAQRWLDSRPGFADGMAKANMPLEIKRVIE